MQNLELAACEDDYQILAVCEDDYLPLGEYQQQRFGSLHINITNPTADNVAFLSSEELPRCMIHFCIQLDLLKFPIIHFQNLSRAIQKRGSNYSMEVEILSCGETIDPTLFDYCKVDTVRFINIEKQVQFQRQINRLTHDHVPIDTKFLKDFSFRPELLQKIDDQKFGMDTDLIVSYSAEIKTWKQLKKLQSLTWSGAIIITAENFLNLNSIQNVNEITQILNPSPQDFMGFEGLKRVGVVISKNHKNLGILCWKYLAKLPYLCHLFFAQANDLRLNEEDDDNDQDDEDVFYPCLETLDFFHVGLDFSKYLKFIPGKQLLSLGIQDDSMTIKSFVTHCKQKQIFLPNLIELNMSKPNDEKRFHDAFNEYCTGRDFVEEQYLDYIQFISQHTNLESMGTGYLLQQRIWRKRQLARVAFHVAFIRANHNNPLWWSVLNISTLIPFWELSCGS